MSWISSNSYPCHPRDIRTIREGTGATYVVPPGKMYVLTAIGAQRQAGTAPSGLIAPMADFYANGLIVLRGATLGYQAFENGILAVNPALALKELYGPMMTWAKVPDGLRFSAGTVLKLERVLVGYAPPPALQHVWTGRAAGYLINA